MKKKYTLRYAITAIVVLLAVVASFLGMYYYRLHHYENVAYYNDEGTSYTREENTTALERR